MLNKYLLGIGTAAIVALAAGCGGSDDSSTVDTQPRTTAAAEAPTQAVHNEQDITFAQGMVPHHQQAVDMAAMAAEKAANPQVKDLAGRIGGAQDPEIQQLTDMLAQWGAPPPSSGSSMPGMDHGDMSGHGMMTGEQMHQLEQAAGADFDRVFVQLMIEHHQGAVDMAKTELAQGENADAKALAQKIVDTQEAEIVEMRALTL